VSPCHSSYDIRPFKTPIPVPTYKSGKPDYTESYNFLGKGIKFTVMDSSIKTKWFFASLVICYLLTSCVADCACFKELGCTILNVRKLKGPAANSIVQTKTFCSQTNYYSDIPLHDSVESYRNRYSTDSTYVEERDSIYKTYPTVSLKHNLKQYTDSGYSCNCPR
jgi:hypothetical protein